MALIEVTKEVAKAAKTFISNSQEYCFLFIDWWPLCMTKSEWSGWMQAIGGVASIIGAFLIASRQHSNQINLAKSVSVGRIRAFVASVSASVELLRDSEEVNPLEMQRQHSIIDVTLSSGSTISAEHLDVEWVGALEVARGIAAQLRVLCIGVEKDLTYIDNARDLAGRFLNVLTPHEQFVRKGHPDVP